LEQRLKVGFEVVWDALVRGSAPPPLTAGFLASQSGGGAERGV
jgi:hypothetical protein